MRTLTQSGLILLLLTCPSCAPTKPAGTSRQRNLTPTQPALGPVDPVQLAIQRAQAFLIKARQPDGTWEPGPPEVVNNVPPGDPNGRPWGSLTALTTYALLESGVRPDEPELKPALRLILNSDIESTYGIGYASQVARFLPSALTDSMIKRNVRALLYGIIQPRVADVGSPWKWGPDVGFYGYWVGPSTSGKKLMGKPQPKGWFDRSNSESAVAGMAALQDSGGEVPALYWRIIDAAWRHAELRSGGWDYRQEQLPRVDMTAAGLVTLAATDDLLIESNWAECKGSVRDDWIARGIWWLDQNLSAAMPGLDAYRLFCVARAGLASGRQYFGNADWFEQGADILLSTQRADGSWAGDHGTVHETAFALLFLSLGHRAVQVNKLEYPPSPNGQRAVLQQTNGATDCWNERPADISHLVSWIGKQSDTPARWQQVSLASKAEDLDLAPVLYLSGSQGFDFDDRQVATLHEFIERGGLILGNADCAKPAFAKSFTKLGWLLFPKLQFAPLAADDPIFSKLQLRAGASPPKVLGMGDGKRHFMLLIPEADPARAWQTRSFGTRVLAFQLGRNIVEYAQRMRAQVRAAGLTTRPGRGRTSGPFAGSDVGKQP